ncbi:MAG: PIN domain-containing protein [Spirochaetales bacterium]|nr:PIN domain-containing protein [Spirochaetales bacterium]
MDTDTTVYWLKGDKDIEAKIIAVGLVNVRTTILSCCELYYGAYKSRRIEQNIKAIEELKAKITVVHTSEKVDKIFGKIKADLEKQGTRLDDSDIFIASIVIAEQGTLVSNNVGHFQRIQDLHVENWRRDKA